MLTVSDSKMPFTQAFLAITYDTIVVIDIEVLPKRSHIML